MSLRPPPPLPGIPLIRGLPVLGSLPAFAKDPLDFLSAARRRHGPLVQYRFIGYRVLQVTDPDALEEILLKRASSMHKDEAYTMLRPLLGNGLVTAEEPEWRRNRKLAAPSFSRKQVGIYIDAMARCARDYVTEIGSGETRDLHDDMMNLTQKIVLQTLFGEDLQVDVQAVGDSIEIVMEEFSNEVHRGRRALPSAIRTPGRRRSDRAIQRLDAQVHRLIQARREAGLGKDLLSRLLAAQDTDGSGFDDRQLRDEAVTMFIAGHETTALALTYTLLLLGDHPEVGDRLREEVDTELQGRAPTATDLSRLPWTRAAILESLRLYPPVWAFGRQTIEDVEIAGHLLPRGTQILLPQWVLHREPRFFPRPERYEPERWMDGLESRLPRMAWLPFGGGPRICIGNHFAMMEAMTVLATLMQSLRIRPHGAFPPKFLPSITLRPVGPLLATFSTRRRISTTPAPTADAVAQAADG